ncbi:uncharacterized protein LOC129802775 [Phlebotomus papatasi]|uniref:uncharacterized protein LOC129802775 n=1 Tax=Phlebotomus papatasi TaxID=29031 RepID=UPI0024836F6B|nr:uncharacterized protein LOC129802775 [Phlebotomus papatasi]
MATQEEIHILNEQVMRFNRLFYFLSTLDWVFPPSVKKWTIYLVPYFVLTAWLSCVHTAIVTDTQQVAFLYSVIYIGASYQMIIKYYTIFLSRKNDFDGMMKYMDNLTKAGKLEFADEIRKKRLRNILKISVPVAKTIWIFFNITGVSMMLYGLRETKCCATFCKIPEILLPQDHYLFFPVNLVYGILSFIGLFEVTATLDTYFIVILSYFVGELSAIKEIIQYLDRSEIVATQCQEILLFIHEAHREVLHYIGVLRKIYWHLNIHLIFTGFFYICILLFMTRFYQATIATYFAAMSATIQLFSICLFGQILRNRTEAVGEALYQTRWYEMGLKEQKALLIIMSHSQEPVGLVAGGIMDISLSTFAIVMRTAISYGAILYTVIGD